MKTERLNFWEAVKVLTNGECEAIESMETGSKHFFNPTINNEDHLLSYNTGFSSSLSRKEILGKWKLVNPIIKPIAGEVWEHHGYLYWIVRDAYGRIEAINTSGAHFMIINDINISDVQHNKHGWKIVWSPYREVSK